MRTAEYALIALIVGALVVIGATALGGAISGAFERVNAQLEATNAGAR